jgi:hypothetical protein
VTEPRCPDVSVRLVGTDGNAFAILGRVRRALTDADVSEDDQAAFTAEATSGACRYRDSPPEKLDIARCRFRRSYRQLIGADVAALPGRVHTIGHVSGTGAVEY